MNRYISCPSENFYLSKQDGFFLITILVRLTEKNTTEVGGIMNLKFPEYLVNWREQRLFFPNIWENLFNI
jgi:hypothetical protein